MNHRIIINTIGKLMQLEGVLLLFPTVTGAMFRERQFMSLAIVAVVSILIGGLLRLVKTENSKLRAKEGFVITALSWLIFSIIGAIPFVISGAIPSITDAIFETASGFTTTGASILRDVEALPRCLLLWRSFTHWIGGMGILVFMLAFVPSNADEMNIMRAESPGPSVEKMVPKVRETAFTLYAIYTSMTLVLIICLIISRMPVFDSICIALGTAGTGGFGIRGDSIAGYSYVSQNIITIGMICFGVNFNVYYLILIRRFKSLIHSEEVMVYLIIYAVASGMVAYGIYSGSVGNAIHEATFQVASVMTTTGYATVDFDKWANMPRAIMVLVMFIGACAGSTGGGIKVSRFIIYFKQIRREIQTYIHPSSVRSIKLDGKVVSNETIRTTNAYLMAYILIFVASLVVICFDSDDLVTSFTSVTATINNIGPGLGHVGPTGNFADFNILSKWVFIFDMIAGRLELFPMLIILAPSTWRKK